MLKIAHRGNISGPTIHENQWWYIKKAINLGYDAEIDVWKIDGKLWSGHNSAQYLLDENELSMYSNKLWIHCKNFEALDHFSKRNDYMYFWHQFDSFTLTSNNFIWTYPEEIVGDLSIIVDLKGKTEYNCYGICSDYLE